MAAERASPASANEAGTAGHCRERPPVAVLLLRWHLPLLLVLAIAAGLAFPAPGRAMGSELVGCALVLMFAVAGAKLRTAEAVAALRSPRHAVVMVVFGEAASAEVDAIERAERESPTAALRAPDLQTHSLGRCGDGCAR